MLCAAAMISTPDLHYEKRLWKAGTKFIAGLDEAGRGALAGPVSAGAVILPYDNPHLARTLSGARDSKQMTPFQRDQLAPRIQAAALDWGVGFASAQEIDSLGIVAATRLSALRALEAMQLIPDFLLTDFRLELPELDISQIAIVKGDQRSLSIAAASILAKTARDNFMRELDNQYPQYGFEHHKGYGTLQHREMIARIGYSPIHRKSFTLKKIRIT
jgi:ribonuclease HII